VKLYELEPDTLIAAESEADAVAAIAEDLDVGLDLDDPEMPELRLLRKETAHPRGVLKPDQTEREYSRLRERMLR
jgi:hypothetical protein